MLDLFRFVLYCGRMAFVDELVIAAKAGDGGDGVIRWRHMKRKEFAGPSGGDGGRGGSVYVRGVRDLHLLSAYRNKKEFAAERGGDGGSNSLHGKDGKDLVIRLPVGSVITHVETGKKIVLNKEGQKELLLKGGGGGRGNESFKSSTRRAPYESTKGKPGEAGVFHVEMELIADMGLIGLPNAGKSSLLNELARSRARIGDYPFTTREPNLGECFGYIIADIPGLIEGAALGKGLGHAFLRHIKRAKTLVHLVSLENKDVKKAYQTIRAELGRYDESLLRKKEVIILTKADVLESENAVREAVRAMRAFSPTVLTLTLLNDGSVKRLRDALIREAGV